MEEQLEIEFGELMNRLQEVVQQRRQCTNLNKNQERIMRIQRHLREDNIGDGKEITKLLDQQQRIIEKLQTDVADVKDTLRRVESGIKELVQHHDTQAAHNRRTWEIGPVFEDAVQVDLGQVLPSLELGPSLGEEMDADADDQDPILDNPLPAIQHNQEPPRELQIPYLPFIIPGAVEARTLKNGETVGGEVALPHLFWIPDRAQWQPWNQFAVPFQNEMVTMLRNTILTDQTKRRTWACVTRLPVDAVDRTRCIAWTIIGKGSKRGISSWDMSNGNSNFACDTCVTRKRPCLRVMAIPGFADRVIVWCPLPDAMRTGAEEGTMACYVRA